MAKVKTRIYEVDPNKIIELGFHKESNEVSESIFSLGNEYMGVRGFLDEGSSLSSLIGTYYNGIYEYAREDTPSAYKGIVKRTHFTINSTNFFKIFLSVDGIKLDLAEAKIKDFKRVLDLRSGELVRSFIWLVNDNEVSLSFYRLVNMSSPHEAIQKIVLSSKKPAKVKLNFYLDGNVVHWRDSSYWDYLDSSFENNNVVLSLKTQTTNQSLTTAMKVVSPIERISFINEVKEVGENYEFTLNKEVTFIRYIINIADKKQITYHHDSAISELNALVAKGYEKSLEENKNYFSKAYENCDIEIYGSDEDQQGIRYSLFQLEQTYHGYDEENNIGAKGLTGEAYSGHAFWDSETYCLPYYLFTNQKAAKDLLLFRYNTLPNAIKRAKELDCEGACYPIATRNGDEACTLWQHASTQFQPTTAVAYAIYHYMNLYDDKEFMERYGLEMLLEIGRFLLSRGDWNGDDTHFGFYGVMGPDEFQVMVNHNVYTNIMAKFTFNYILRVIEEYKDHPLIKEKGYNEEYIKEMSLAKDKMYVIYHPESKLYEQNLGFFDLPHLDISKIPVEDFPLYSHWSYDRIYRNDMIKQPDVLMFMFLLNQDFDQETLRANFEYYEPRCTHESSLSPSIHSILASQLGKEKQALDFFGFATRLDLDDYNRNTKEGLHVTSITAAWMNIVYGFLGLRSDKPTLLIRPTLPTKWQGYVVKLIYHGSKLKFTVKEHELTIENSGNPVEIKIYDKLYKIESILRVSL